MPCVFLVKITMRAASDWSHFKTVSSTPLIIGNVKFVFVIAGDASLTNGI